MKIPDLTKKDMIKMEGNILWTGVMEYVSVSIQSLKDAGWTDEMIDDLLEMIREDGET